MARLIELERKFAFNLHRSLPVTDFELLIEKIDLEMQLDCEMNPRKEEDFLNSFNSLVDISATTNSFVDISAITLGDPTTYEPIITLTSEEGWYNDISDSRRLLRTNSLDLHQSG
jgi:hypothetical protein